LKTHPSRELERETQTLRKPRIQDKHRVGSFGMFETACRYSVDSSDEENDAARKTKKKGDGYKECASRIVVGIQYP